MQLFWRVGQRGGGGAGGGTTDRFARSQLATITTSLAAKADKVDHVTDPELAAALLTKADQTAVDNLIAASATKVELTAVETKIDAHIASHPDVKLTSVTREADQSLKLTMSDGQEFTVSADTALAARVTVLEDFITGPKTVTDPTAVPNNVDFWYQDELWIKDAQGQMRQKT